MRWRDIEAVEDGGLIHLIDKGGESRTVQVSTATLENSPCGRRSIRLGFPLKPLWQRPSSTPRDRQ